MFQTGPWLRVVYGITGNTDVVYKVSDIATGVRKQLGWFTGTTSPVYVPCKLSFLSVHAWGLTVDKPIALTPSVLLIATGFNSGLEPVLDFPARNAYSRVGFVWDKVNQDAVFDHGIDADVTVFAVDTAASASYAVQLTLRIRALPASIALADMEKLLRPVSSPTPFEILE